MSKELSAQLPASENRDIRLVFFDIDGTLIGSDGNYSDRTKREINRIQSLGITTAIASGRPRFAAQFIINELALNGAGLFSAGATLIDPATNKVIEKTELELEGLVELINYARQFGMHCEIYTEDAYWVESHSDIQLAHSRVLRSQAKLGQFKDLFSEGLVPIKLLIGINELEQPGILKAMAEIYPHYHFAIARMVSHPDWLFASIISGKVDKGAAFHRLCNYHGVTAEQVIAFGDAPSDSVFLALAGIGVAMGNAADEVKLNANFVTLSVDEDGIAHALAELVPE